MNGNNADRPAIQLSRWDAATALRRHCHVCAGHDSECAFCSTGSEDEEQQTLTVVNEVCMCCGEFHSALGIPESSPDIGPDDYCFTVGPGDILFYKCTKGRTWERDGHLGWHTLEHTVLQSTKKGESLPFEGMPVVPSGGIDEPMTAIDLWGWLRVTPEFIKQFNHTSINGLGSCDGSDIVELLEEVGIEFSEFPVTGPECHDVHAPDEAVDADAGGGVAAAAIAAPAPVAAVPVAALFAAAIAAAGALFAAAGDRPETISLSDHTR